MKVWIIIILIVGAILGGLTWRSTTQQQISGQRIIALSPAITEIVFELGLGEQIVGASEHSDYPPEAKQILRMGKYGDPNIELILWANPDLVISQRISSDEMMLMQNELAGVSKFLLLKADTLAEIVESTQRIAQATNTAERGQKLTDRWQRKIEQLEAQNAQLPDEERVRVYVEIGANPLQTCGPGNYLSQMIHLAGGKNLGDATTGNRWPIISSETVVVWNPQLILVLGMKRTGGFKEQISSRLGWDNIEAVRTGRIVELPEEFNRQGPRLFEVAGQLAQIITGDVPAGAQD